MALVLGAGAGLPSRLYLASVRDVPPQAVNIFIIDLVYFIDTEGADLASRGVTWFAAFTSRRSCWFSCGRQGYLPFKLGNDGIHV